MKKQSTENPSDASAKQPPLKEFFDKCYVLYHSEKYEQFLKELGVKKMVRVRAAKSKPRVTLSLQMGEYLLTTSYPELEDVSVKFSIGEPVKRLRPGGSTAISVFDISGNKLIEEQQLDDKTVVIERTFSKTNLTVTMEVNHFKCSRFYLLSTSKHSIGTETSRRSSLWRTPTPEEYKPSPEVESILERDALKSETESEENVCF